MSDDHIRVGDQVRHTDPGKQRCCSRGRVVRVYRQMYGNDQGELRAEVRWAHDTPQDCPWRANYQVRNLTKEGVRER